MSEETNRIMKASEVFVNKDGIEFTDSEKMELGDGNYAVKSEGLITVHLKDDRQIFGMDANTFPFEKTIMVGALQIFMAGVRAGGKGEREQVRMKLSQVLNLVFE